MRENGKTLFHNPSCQENFRINTFRSLYANDFLKCLPCTSRVFLPLDINSYKCMSWLIILETSPIQAAPDGLPMTEYKVSFLAMLFVIDVRLTKQPIKPRETDILWFVQSRFKKFNYQLDSHEDGLGKHCHLMSLGL